MESVLGGGVLLAVAAALWLVYLVPNWLRRSEYLATERNAVRLQQTIRVLAETAETPEAVRLETAAKARALEASLRRQRPVAVGAPVTLQDPGDPYLLAVARMRRVRIATTVAIVVAALALLAQLAVALVAGPAALSWLLVLVAGGCFGAGLWLQGRLARAQRLQRQRAGSRSERSESPATVRQATRSVAPPPVADVRLWAPQPLPQPIHHLRREAALRAAADAEREAVAREAEERRILAASLSERSESPPARSRFASMGVLDDRIAAIPDIDGALARRRAS